MIRKNPWSSLRMHVEWRWLWNRCLCAYCGIELTFSLERGLYEDTPLLRNVWERERQTQRQKKIQKSKSANRSTTTEIKASVSARHILGLYLPAFGADQACLSATSTKMHQLTGNSFITIIITNNSRTNPPTILSTEVIRIGGSPKN